MAQQPQPEESPSKKQSTEKKTHPVEAKSTPHAAEVRPGPTHPPRPQVPAVKEPAATHTPAVTHTPVVTKAEKKTPSPQQPAAIATPAAKKQQSTTIATPAAPKAIATPPAAATSSTAPPVSQTNQTKAPVNPAAAAKKPDPQQVQQIKAQHQNFHAQPKPEQVPAVTFSASYRIQGSEQWQGPKYEVYRAYHPERHDEGWYRSHYTRVELVGGGYYYWNNGYWYPAWGYSPASEYYAYDAPIYVGKRAEPPDKVIADVQAVLQEMGYYKGEVDGLLGPLTREALTAYQGDQGLVATAVMDEPTLDSLGMG